MDNIENCEPFNIGSADWYSVFPLANDYTLKYGNILQVKIMTRGVLLLILASMTGFYFFNNPESLDTIGEYKDFYIAGAIAIFLKPIYERFCL